MLDDDENFCQILARQFQERNYQVYIANDVTQAFEVIKQNKPELAVFDLRLQEGSSLDFIAEAKALMPEIRILILTGYASIRSIVKAIKLGATNYLAKPADFAAILNAIEGEWGEENANIGANLKIMEMELIQNTLAENDYNVSQTAKKLNMHRRTLQRKLQKKVLT